MTRIKPLQLDDYQDGKHTAGKSDFKIFMLDTAFQLINRLERFFETHFEKLAINTDRHILFPLDQKVTDIKHRHFLPAREEIDTVPATVQPAKRTGTEDGVNTNRKYDNGKQITDPGDIVEKFLVRVFGQLFGWHQIKNYFSPFIAGHSYLETLIE
jgi:hypothetical protein